ncbi:MAG TPA: hypothetical protein VIL24_05540 [Clostridia bacterium]
MPSALLAFSAQKIIIAVAIVAIQYVLALIAFVKISKTELTLKKLLIFNFLIVFVFYIGPIIAIVYAHKKGKEKGSQDLDQNNNLDK